MVPQAYFNPNNTIAKAIAVQKGTERGSSAFSLKITARGNTTVVHGSIDYIKGSAVEVRVKQSSIGHQSDRIYKVQGGKFSAYDFYGDEAIHRSVPSSVALTKRLAFVFGAVPDPVKVVVDPDWLSTFLHGFAKSKTLVGSKANGAITLKAAGSHKFESLQLSFDKSGRLTSFLSKNGMTSFQWSVSYSSKYHPQEVPSGGAEVKAFKEHTPPPTYANAAARSECQLAIRAFRHLKPSKILVQRPGNQVIVYWDRGMLRQNSGKTAWAYNGAVLVVQTGGAFYKGKANHADVLDYLAFLTNGEDSLARTLLLNGNVLQTFLGPSDQVRISGKMNVQGVPSTLIEVKGPGGKSSIVLRNSDHLVVSTETDNFGSDGRVAFHDECTYKYLPFKEDRSIFTLRSKLKPKALPKMAIKMGSKYYHPELQYQPVPIKGHGRKPSKGH